MTARDFCFWLQGFFEVAEAGSAQTLPLTFAQIDAIKRHLSLVFAHDIDPKAGPKDVQDKLNHLHHAGKDILMRC